MKAKNKKTHKHNRALHIIGRVFLWIVGVFATLAVAVWIAFQVSPWPSALLIRDEFQKAAAAQVAAMQKYIPPNVHASKNHHYITDDPDAYLDTFYPSSITDTSKLLPTIVWVHGGGWVSGDKDNVDPYAQILASHGYTTVSVNYTIAPEKTYPTPLLQLNEALTYVTDRANELHIDKNQIILAGDSAGSQIVAQMATLITNPTYANTVDIPPTLNKNQLVGMILNCGAYDLSLADADSSDAGAKLLHVFLWSYSGEKNYADDPALKYASVINYVTKNFPPSFITAGNADPLLAQSTTFAKKLQSLDVTTSTLFYPGNYSPALQHEYQFELDTKAGKKALDQILTFIHARTTP